MRNFFVIDQKKLTRYATAFGLFALLILVSLFLFSHPALAGTHLETSLEKVGTASGLPQQSLPILIARLIRVVLGVLGILTVILVIYAGFTYMLAAGDDTKVKKAKKILSQTIIGLIIIFSSYAITSYILGKLLAAAFGGGTVSVQTAKKYNEPLAGSLGAGIIESHYPTRNAPEIPRNTKIFVTFKIPIKVSSIIKDFDTKPLSTDLNTAGVKIYETVKGEVKTALKAEDVVVSFDSDHKIFVFKPKEYLGNEKDKVNYTVFLTPNILNAAGKDAFVGSYKDGYPWTFTVNTTVDLVPPHILNIKTPPPAVSPKDGSTQPKNMVVEMTFNEPMDPISAAGIFKSDKVGENFSNIQVKDPSLVKGKFEISNGYTSVGFKTFDACAKDPCGSTIYCLPAPKSITVDVLAPELDPNPKNFPQAKPINGVFYNGLADASGNAFDGKGTWEKAKDVAGNIGWKPEKYTWGFTTIDKLDETTPTIESLDPVMGKGEINQTAPLQILFNREIESASINSTNISLWADPFHSLWFTSNKKSTEGAADKTTVSISHGDFVPKIDATGQFYWPVVTHGVKGMNQYCMFPSKSTTCLATNDLPFCCNGVAQAKACTTKDNCPSGDKNCTLPLNK